MEKNSNKILIPITRNSSLCPEFQPRTEIMHLSVCVCVHVCVRPLLPNTDRALKHLQRWHFAPYIKETQHPVLMTPLAYFECIPSYICLIITGFFISITAKILKRLQAYFILCLRETISTKQKSGTPDQQTSMRSPCLLNWFQLLLPHQ